MDHRAEQLHRRIDRYRGYLRDGLNKELAGFYLKQIAHHEAKLKQISPRPERLMPKGAANS